ncbi:MAG: phosphate ABC transporter permease subunit PstC [Candidatus Omnitrophica bacterium]|nr:phosphate ABC transporter permease subunit PstC [Candidatus Omnitrophota bacterium]
MRKIKEFIIEKMILLCGLAAIFFVGLIFLFLLKEGLAVFKMVGPFDFLFGKSWYPISEPPKLGILPLIMGSLLVTLGAAIISIPIGVGCAVYIAEIAPGKTKEILKAGIELLAAIPSVVLGFIGMVTLVPLVKNLFHLPTGLTALSGSIMLAFMAMPTIVSIAEDALYSIPRNYKEGAFALGATHWQTIWRVLLPAASSGILAAVMLGIGRVIGETMAVMMITGNAAVLPQSILVPIRTLTATVAAEMGEAVVGSEHYFALFAIGIVLFIISFIINVTADLFLHKKQ